MHITRLLTILGLIMIGIMSRLLPHPPNFTSINAIALFSAFYLGNRWLSFATVFLTLFLSDRALGFHSTMPYIYFSFGLIVMIGYKFKSNISLYRLPIISMATSLLFFLISNFGVWMIGFLYPKTINGLGLCYLAALPFLRNQILGDLTYGILLFGLFYFMENVSHIKNAHANS
jgi:hypothetical protein